LQQKRRPWESDHIIFHAEFEFYDPEQDHLEIDNPAEEPGHAGILEEYKGKLKKLRELTGDL